MVMAFLFPVLASILFSSAPLDTTQPKTASFLVISDIHLDPLKEQTAIPPAARNANSFSLAYPNPANVDTP